MNSKEAQKLVNKYNQGTISQDEKNLLEHWYLNEGNKQLLLDDEITNPEQLKQAVWLGTLEKAGLANQSQAIRRSLWPRVAAAVAAAVVLLFVSFAGYHLLNKQEQAKQFALVQKIKPGGNNAVLILANGKQIILNNAQNGQLANQSNTVIYKNADGQVSYKAGDGKAAALNYNTISTPRGGQYTLVLSDGTKVTLNAASSIKYPVQFVGSERNVELSGEAYFEVAHNKAMPFKVKTANQQVEVLGTHFNVNAYADESNTKTTLLEGSVKVSSNNNQKMLVPGEQSVLNGKAINVYKANVDEAVAWKDGYFRFDNEPLPVILRQFSRWYNINIVYKGHTNDQYFTGKIARNANLARVLNILQLGGVHYKMDNEQLMILPD